MQRQHMDLAHRSTTGGVHHLMPAHGRLAVKARAGDDRLTMRLQPAAVRVVFFQHLEVRGRQLREGLIKAR